MSTKNCIQSDQLVADEPNASVNRLVRRRATQEMLFISDVSGGALYRTRMGRCGAGTEGRMPTTGSAGQGASRL